MVESRVMLPFNLTPGVGDGFLLSQSVAPSTSVTRESALEWFQSMGQAKIVQACLLHDSVVVLAGDGVPNLRFPPPEFRELDFVEVIPSDEWCGGAPEEKWQKALDAETRKDLEHQDYIDAVRRAVLQNDLPNAPFLPNEWGLLGLHPSRGYEAINALVSKNSDLESSWAFYINVIFANANAHGCHPVLAPAFARATARKMSILQPQVRAHAMMSHMIITRAPEIFCSGVDDVKAMRKERTVRALRNHINDFASHVSAEPENSGRALDDAIVAELWEIAEQHRARPRTTILKACFSTIFPFFGILSEATSLASSIYAWRSPKWVFGVMTLQEMAARKREVELSAKKTLDL